MRELIELYSNDDVGNHIATIELWYDVIPEDATVSAEFQERWHNFMYGAEYENYSGVILDSTTSLLRAYFNWEKFQGPNKKTKKGEDPGWKLHDYAKGHLEPVLSGIASIPVPVIINCHVSPETDSDIEGVSQYWPRMPGQLKRDVKGLFGEVYFVRKAVTKVKNEDGFVTGTNVEYYVQVDEADKFIAFSQFDKVKELKAFDHKTFPFGALLKEAKECGNPYPHILLCGEPGTGKSTWAATMLRPKVKKPVLVLMFDPRDKATPYLRRGIVR